MEMNQIIMTGLGLVCAGLGWFARELYGATQALRRDLSALEVRMSTDYVRYDRMQDALQPVMDSLKEIKQTLDKKADK